MIGSISATSAASSVPLSLPIKLVPSSFSSKTSNEDTVQLSDETQQHLANSAKSAAPPAQQQSITQIIKEAADGNIAALAKLALIA